jgi:membrane associated rhomboid family serine protease
MIKFNTATNILIFINLITFVLQSLLGIDLIQIYGLKSFASGLFKPYQIFTHLFVHSNFMQLLSNIFAFYNFGPIIENTLSSQTFIRFYIIAGVGSALIYSSLNYIEISKKKTIVTNYILQPSPEEFEKCINKLGKLSPALYRFKESFYSHQTDENYIKQSISIAKELYRKKTDISIIGSTAVTFALMTAVALLFPNMKMLIMLFPIPIKTKYFVTLYAVYEIYSTIKDNQTDNIAHIAHICGIVLSFIFIKLWMRRNNINPS